MSLNNDLKKLKETKKLYREIEKKVIEEAERKGYKYNPETGEAEKCSTTVTVCNLYIRSESRYEDYGLYSAYAGLLKVPRGLIEKIKPLLVDEEKISQLFVAIDSYYEDADNSSNILDNFYNCMKNTCHHPDYVVVKELECNYSNLDEDLDSREGIEDIYGEVFFYNADRTIDGYISFFELRSDIYEKNKFETPFDTEKYIRNECNYVYKRQK